ncbi:hypothetical protein V2J09_015370 [Rumex salicifolius]
MKLNALHLLLIIMLVCTHLIPSSSIPIPRITKHMLLPLGKSKNRDQITSEKEMKNEVVEQRKDFQINDYPSTGPNTDHTPKPPH